MNTSNHMIHIEYAKRIERYHEHVVSMINVRNAHCVGTQHEKAIVWTEVCYKHTNSDTDIIGTNSAFLYVISSLNLNLKWQQWLNENYDCKSKHNKLIVF